MLGTVLCGRVKYESFEFGSREPAFMLFFVSCLSIHVCASWPSESPSPLQSLFIGQKRYKLYLPFWVLVALAWPTLRGSKSTQGAYLPTVYRHLLPRWRNLSVVFAAAAAPRRGSLVGPLLALPSLSLPSLPLPPPMPSNPLSHEKLTWRHLHTGLILAAHWPGASRPASGLSYQWRRRLRDSRGEDKLLHDTSPFSAPTAAIALSFYFFFTLLLLHLSLRLSSFVVSLWERGVGPDWWSTPFRTALSPLWMQCGLYIFSAPRAPPPLYFCLDPPAPHQTAACSATIMDVANRVLGV